MMLSSLQKGRKRDKCHTLQEASLQTQHSKHSWYWFQEFWKPVFQRCDVQIPSLATTDTTEHVCKNKQRMVSYIAVATGCFVLHDHNCIQKPQAWWTISTVQTEAGRGRIATWTFVPASCHDHFNSRWTISDKTISCDSEHWATKVRRLLFRCKTRTVI